MRTWDGVVDQGGDEWGEEPSGWVGPANLPNSQTRGVDPLVHPLGLISEWPDPPPADYFPAADK